MYFKYCGNTSYLFISAIVLVSELGWECQVYKKILNSIL